MVKRVKLSRHEQEIEKALLKGEYLNVKKSEFEDIAQAIAASLRPYSSAIS